MEPLQETTPAGAPSVPVPPPVAVRWLHGTFHSRGALVLLLLWGANKQGEDTTASHGAGNEEALSRGQLQLQHSLGSVLVTAWQDRGVPASPWHHPARVPRSGLARWAGGLLAQPCGTRAPTAWTLQPLGLGKVFLLPIQHWAHCSTAKPRSLPSAFSSAAEVGERRRRGKEGGRDGKGPPLLTHKHPPLSGHKF